MDGDSNRRKLSLLSIVIDDVDSTKPTGGGGKTVDEPVPQKLTPDDSIKKLLEEAEHRKLEFWKLIDEHTEVIENLKKIENREVEPTSKKPIMRP